MKRIKFNDLEGLLKTGREIEFSYLEKNYSITNDSQGYWNFCLDEEWGSVLLEPICPYKELDYLPVRVADIKIEGKSIKEIFDSLLYEESSLCIL